jgi:hypothetical protein
MSPAHELAEQNLSATGASPTDMPHQEGNGDLAPGTEGPRKEVAPPGGGKDEADRPRFVRMSRVTRQEWAPSILIFLLDVLTWMALYGTASYLRNDDGAFPHRAPGRKRNPARCRPFHSRKTISVKDAAFILVRGAPWKFVQC